MNNSGKAFSIDSLKVYKMVNLRKRYSTEIEEGENTVEK
jgi:hypothetical protein